MMLDQILKTKMTTKINLGIAMAYTILYDSFKDTEAFGMVAIEETLF